MTDRIYVVYCDGRWGIRQYVNNIDNLGDITFVPSIKDAMHFDYNGSRKIVMLLGGRGVYKNVNGRIDPNRRNTLVRPLLYGENSL